ncbi:MAG: hypothetical protein M3Y87_12270 [Myxococcota bacterium]|nr:hypothetical protein [Myxococcota bacterium]
MSNESPRIGRRAWIGRSLVVLAAVPALGACGGGGLTCESESLAADQAAMRRTLHYVDRSTNPSRACTACALYTGTEASCGTCTVIGGAIHPQGTCDSFVARS